MTGMPSVGTRVKVSCRGSWPREGYRVPVVDCFEGEVVPPFPWLGGEYLCLTTNDYKIPVRSIKISSIIQVSAPSGEVFTPSVPAQAEKATYTVSGSKGAVYVVTREAGKWHCNCPAGNFNRSCRHVREVETQASKQPKGK